MFKRKKSKPVITPISPKKSEFNSPMEMHNRNELTEIVFILDGEIQDAIVAEERLAAILLSEPTIVDVTSIDPKPMLGWKYDSETKGFTNPNEKKP